MVSKKKSFDLRFTKSTWKQLGFETAAELLFKGCTARLAALSGSTEAELMEDFPNFKVHNPFHCYLLKPITPEGCFRLAQDVLWEETESGSTDTDSIISGKVRASSRLIQPKQTTGRDLSFDTALQVNSMREMLSDSEMADVDDT